MGTKYDKYEIHTIYRNQGDRFVIGLSIQCMVSTQQGIVARTLSQEETQSIIRAFSGEQRILQMITGDGRTTAVHIFGSEGQNVPRSLDGQEQEAIKRAVERL